MFERMFDQDRQKRKIKNSGQVGGEDGGRSVPPAGWVTSRPAVRTVSGMDQTATDERTFG
ncbi:hypothetical protein [Blastococcus brunescens]|uniref:Uncharacterized protein n=1 Tax=Blastococcus brunescens TaxID=1564165 RepID=A0ABZ1AV17_9ACTN|nr:hypothetical protein [Blastococcus sp. BMG 8361]WRL62415.1 hypothetical protein U6N30_20655 [Blastococcus sp. BMG 8361]